MPSPVDLVSYEAYRKGITEARLQESEMVAGWFVVCNLRFFFASVVYVLDEQKCFGCFLRYNVLAEKYLQM